MTPKDFLNENREGYYQEDFQKIRTAYLAVPNDFYYSWQYLLYHPIYNSAEGVSYFDLNLNISVEKVDPETDYMNIEDESKNIKTKIMLESGPVYRRDDAPAKVWEAVGIVDNPEGVFWSVHDPSIDSEGDTFEEAIITLARKVQKNYGDDRSDVY